MECTNSESGGNKVHIEWQRWRDRDRNAMEWGSLHCIIAGGDGFRAQTVSGIQRTSTRLLRRGVGLSSTKSLA